MGSSGVGTQGGEPRGIANQRLDGRAPSRRITHVKNNAGRVLPQETGDGALWTAEKEGGPAGGQDAVELGGVDQALACGIQADQMGVGTGQGTGKLASRRVALETHVRDPLPADMITEPPGATAAAHEPPTQARHVPRSLDELDDGIDGMGAAEISAVADRKRLTGPALPRSRADGGVGPVMDYSKVFATFGFWGKTFGFQVSKHLITKDDVAVSLAEGPVAEAS